MKGFLIETIGEKTICLRGLGKMFYQDGMPIGVMAIEMEKKGIEISWLHVADELQKCGWNNKTILSKLKEESADSAVKVDFDLISYFLEQTYENQREIIFQTLFGCTTNDVRTGLNTTPLEWLKNRIINA